MLVFFRKFKPQLYKKYVHARSTKHQLVRLLLILAAILAVHTVAMVVLEKLSLMDAFWLTMTSATTVGYGDLSAVTLYGRMATVLLLYVIGIAVLAQAASMYFEYRQEVRARVIKGECSWKMKNHIVFLNCSEELSDDYFYQAISQLRGSCVDLASTPIIIVSQHFTQGLPHRLQELDVVHVNKSISDDEVFSAVNITEAHTAIVMASRHLDPMSDSISFELIDRLRERGFKGHILAEAVRDSNRTRLMKAGANNVLRPIRSYPELLMRAILAPGAEQVIETLFNSDGEECIRYDLNFKGAWLGLIRALSEADVGMPIAYETQAGEIINNPSSKQVVDACAIFLIVRPDDMRTNDELSEILKSAIT